MGVKNWIRQQKRKRLTGVEALDHGIVKGKGIPYLDRWQQGSEVKYWGPMPEKEAYKFYMSLPGAKESPRLGSLEEFRKWNTKRKTILKSAEADFKEIEGIGKDAGLSQAQKNRLGEFTRQRINQLNEKLGSRI